MPLSIAIIAALHSAATLCMVGLIWFVQIVHYPLFASVGADRFGAYEARHQRLTTCVVAPLMFVELATAALLLCYRPPGIAPAFLWGGLLLVLAIWLMTAMIQVPLHTALTRRYEAPLQERLVASNWWRTWAWTARGVIAMWITLQGMR